MEKQKKNSCRLLLLNTTYSKSKIAAAPHKQETTAIFP